MSEQEKRTSPTRLRRSSKAKSEDITEQAEENFPPPPATAIGELKDWPAHWQEHEQSWRTEPEISPARQKELDKRRREIKPDIEKGTYPFKHIHPKLTRADVEWLLASHESAGIRGPVDWGDERHKKRKGIDLRGADLRGIDLSNLPLACLIGGISNDDVLDVFARFGSTPEQREMAAAHFEGAYLVDAHLENASLSESYFDEAIFYKAHLEGAVLIYAHMQKTRFQHTHLARLCTKFLSNRPHEPTGQARNEGLKRHRGPCGMWEK